MRVTLWGQPFAPFGAGSNRLVARSVETRKTFALFTRVADTTVRNTLTVVGRADRVNRNVTWYLIDAVSNETRFQGVVAVDPSTQVYASSLAVPPGDYLLQTTTSVNGRNTRTNYAVTVR